MKNFLIAVFVAATLFFSCKTTSSVAGLRDISCANNFSATAEKNYFLVEIDLSSSELEIKTYPKNSGFSKPVSVKKFAEQNECFAAINANPFVTSSKMNPLFSKRKPVGLYVDNFTRFSEPQEKYAAIAFFKEENGYSAKILDSQTEIENEKTPAFAAGGFWTILRGEKIPGFKDIKDFRSAAGLSADGRKLYLFCGKKISYQDTAKILKEKNVFSALQFDGGPSSQLYFCEKNRQNSAKKQLPSVILGFANKTNNSNNKIDE